MNALDDLLAPLDGLDEIDLANRLIDCREGALAELEALRAENERLREIRCPTCGTVLDRDEGYYWCPNKECGQYPNGDLPA